MIAQHSVLVQLVGLLDHIPAPSCSTSHRRRGRPVLYSDALFLKALVITIVRRLHMVGELLAVARRFSVLRSEWCQQWCQKGLVADRDLCGFTALLREDSTKRTKRVRRRRAEDRKVASALLSPSSYYD